MQLQPLAQRYKILIILDNLVLLDVVEKMFGDFEASGELLDNCSGLIFHSSDDLRQDVPTPVSTIVILNHRSCCMTFVPLNKTVTFKQYLPQLCNTYA